MSFGNASAERAAIEMTYEDTATVSRTTPQRGQNAISASDPSVIYSGIICAVFQAGFTPLGNPPPDLVIEIRCVRRLCRLYRTVVGNLL